VEVKRWYVPRGLCLAAVLVGVLAAGTAPAAEAVADDVDYGELADACAERGEFEEALKWYDRGLALEPEDVYLRVGKAEALYRLERLEEALACYDRALELTPDEILPNYEEGRILAIFGQLFPWSLHKRKADILAELGRLEEAIESYDRALEFLGDGNIERKKYVYKSKIKVLKESGALEEALGKCDDALARDPDDRSLYFYRLELLTELGRNDEAARTLARAAEMGFEDADSFIAKFYEYAGRGEYEKAESYSGAALALRPNDLEALILNGWALIYAGKYDDALDCADRALALDADSAGGWGLKGVALLLTGEAEAALGCLERALELDAEQPTVHLMKGAVYFMQDKYAQARAAFERCLAFDGYEYALLYLYIVDRADGQAGVERLGPLLASQDDLWGRDIARFLASETGAEDLLATAGDDKTLLCEGHCYIGYKNKLDGDAAAARRHFEEAVAAGARHYLGYILSEYELRRLGAARE
jgi:tetratricopeptide (TPR) repeat protein